MPTDFEKSVYEILKKIPKGKVITYKAIARKLGKKSSYRAVGNALNKNPYGYFAISSEAIGNRRSSIRGDLACHRVIKSNGEVGGFAHGTKRKIKMLEKEGIKIEEGKVDLKKFEFDL
ncbi:MGMT family protein [Candidatus Pacearchaeota archaeon]|nr:MGMT family protein [Candidatus Pacearchaeota archaeon]